MSRRAPTRWRHPTRRTRWALTCLVPLPPQPRQQTPLNLQIPLTCRNRTSSPSRTTSRSPRANWTPPSSVSGSASPPASGVATSGRTASGRSSTRSKTHIEGVSLRGRIDAVFRTEDEDGERWVLVDWKSGSRPKMATMQSRRFQLGLYRIAFSRIMGVDPERISTVFVYLGGKGVAEVWDHQIRGGLPSEAQLAKVIREARKG